MATRALQLRGPLTRLFADIESHGANAAIKWSGFLANKLKPKEWHIIKILQKVLKHFDVTCKQLQGNLASAYNRLTCERFNEYYPVIELLLNHLKMQYKASLLRILKKTAISNLHESTFSRVYFYFSHFYIL
jgi:hypothetical protein